MGSIRLQTRLAFREAAKLRREFVESKRLGTGFRGSGLSAGLSAIAFGLYRRFHFIDYDRHHSTSN
jgi:hypothetical protein